MMDEGSRGVARPAATPAARPVPESAKAQRKKRRPSLSQEDVPAYSLEHALRIPMALATNYAFRPTRPMNVAQAINMSPSSGPFRTLTGSAIAYGLTTGGYNASEIALT